MMWLGYFDGIVFSTTNAQSLLTVILVTERGRSPAETILGAEEMLIFDYRYKYLPIWSSDWFCGDRAFIKQTPWWEGATGWLRLLLQLASSSDHHLSGAGSLCEYKQCINHQLDEGRTCQRGSCAQGDEIEMVLVQVMKLCPRGGT